MNTPIPPASTNSARTARQILCLITTSFIIAILNPEARAAVIIEHTAGGGGAGTYPGNLVTTPAGGPWDDITFSWLVGGTPNVPSAVGSLFLFGEPYLGTPQELATGSPPNLIAQSVSTVGGVYSFAPGVTLQPGTAYYFYSEATQLIGFDTASPGENAYWATFASGPLSNYSSESPLSNKYRLGGDVVPEPSAGLLAIVGMTALSSVLRRRTRG